MVVTSFPIGFLTYFASSLGRTVFERYEIKLKLSGEAKYSQEKSMKIRTSVYL